MEKLIKLFKNHEGKNWTLFLTILGLVHSAWWFGTFDFIKKFGTQNPYFIFLEIFFIASSITRILIVIDIFYILANFCLADDLLKIVWKKREDEWKIFEDRYELLKARHPNKFYEIDIYIHFQRQFPKAELNPYFKQIEDREDMKKYIVDFMDFIETFGVKGKLPYHIQYWVKLKAEKSAKKLSLTKQELLVKK